jgi:Transposase IS66 family
LACPHCAHALDAADQSDTHAYDHIDLPAISPTITRINRHRGACPWCCRRVAAPSPEGFEPGSPFGPGLCALIVHLHVTQAIGFERLARLLAEVFGLTISEGAIGNILARAKTPLPAAAAPIAATVRSRSVVGSDETSARVAGKTWWQWVLLGSTAIYHVIADTRAASMVTTLLDGARPAGLCSGSLRRATRARDGSPDVPDPSAARCEVCDRGRRRSPTPTTPASERCGLPSFFAKSPRIRAEWGATVYAAAASIIATGRLHGLTALAAIRTALDGGPIIRAG